MFVPPEAVSTFMASSLRVEDDRLEYPHLTMIHTRVVDGSPLADFRDDDVMVLPRWLIGGVGRVGNA